MRGRVLAAVVCVSVALPAVATAAGSTATAPSALAAVHVVGSGPIVWGQVVVRAEPSRASRILKVLGQFRSDFRPRFVLALSQVNDPATGKPTWYRVEIPGRPNGRSGWVPAASVSLKPVSRWLVIYRGSRKFEFYVNGTLRRTGKVAVGRPGMETPLGLFYVQAKYVPTWSVLGAYAFETSGYSKLSDWPGGGVVGVHGTNTPQFIGQAVSHGCVRLYNRDIRYLRELIGVGTPIKIVSA